ncbi:MAG: histidinol dehydrogenase [Betaproteobacteria bacterium]|nr:histidinol dehydrogenase [Betaproteobacteria bacterium]
MKIRRLSSQEAGFREAIDALLAFENTLDARVDAVAREVIERVRRDGDAALLEFTQRFDRWSPPSPAALEIPRADLHRALDALDPALRAALDTAHRRIRAFHERQRQPSWQFTEPDGTVLGQQVMPLDRAGLYVPGGKAAYPSSVLMNAVAAKVAGVGEILMVTPTPDGARNDTVLAAAALAGVDRVFAVGGAQAVAALAWGTPTIPAVDKIVGPGNAYVAAAKRQVFGVVGIDMVAGPSEILIIADGAANADWLAIDLLSQAEHDEIAQAILVSPDRALLDRVAASLARQVDTLPRAAIARASIENRGALIEVRDLAEAVDLANTIAPEHLELQCAGAGAWVPRIRHAGAIFIGAHSSEALGDYCAGPNHVLPTARTARFSSPLGVHDFQKRSSILQVSAAGARTLGPTAAALARAEGLEAHARSADIRYAPP